MEHKTWRWRRKASEKTIVANGRASYSPERNVEEDQDEETGSGRCRSSLSDKFSSAVCERNAKDELIRKHARMADQALAGREMAEEEAAYLKKELDKALQQAAAAEQRLAHLDAALKECMREIESLREEHDERIHKAFLKANMDFQNEKKKMEGKLAEANKRISNTTAENANLMKALLCKEKLIKDLDKGKAQLEAEFEMLMGRLDSAEKENTFLKYEFSLIERELELRNKENGKQINRLEIECQQLRCLIRKRLQGPFASLNMKNEDVSRKDQASMVRRPNKGTSFLIKRVYDMEEENKTLREILALSDGELQSWRIKHDQVAVRLAEAEARLKQLSEGENSMQLAISGFDLCNNDDSESWANALLAELEQFRKVDMKNQLEHKAIEMGVTNDLVKTEHFAHHQSQSTSKELVPVPQGDTSGKRKDELVGECGSWLDEILKLMLEEHRVSKRSLGELLRDIKIALGCKENENNVSIQKDEGSSNITGLLTWKSPGVPNNDILVEEEKGHNVEDASFVREKIRKHFGFERSTSESQLLVAAPSRHNTLSQMIKIQTTLQEENREMKEEVRSMTEENLSLRKQVHKSNQDIESLQREVDTLRESKGFIEDQIENQKLITEDLDTQLTAAKAKSNEILHKLSSLQVELEDKSNCCEELEATCLELQLQLETLSRKESPNLDINQVAKKLHTETIQNLGKQLKALASPDTKLVDKVLYPMTTITPANAPASINKSVATRRSSLHDCMLSEDDYQTQGINIKCSKTKDEASEGGDLQQTPRANHNDLKALPAPELKVRSPEQFETLAIVPCKKQSGGFGFIRKLFLRKKRGGSKMRAAPLQRNASALMRQREVLLVV